MLVRTAAFLLIDREQAEQWTAGLICCFMPAKATTSAAMSGGTPPARAQAPKKKTRKPDTRKGSRRRKTTASTSTDQPAGPKPKAKSGKHAPGKKRPSSRHKPGARGKKAWLRLRQQVVQGVEPPSDWAAECKRLSSLCARLYEMLEEQTKSQFREHAKKTGISKYAARLLFGRD